MLREEQKVGPEAIEEALRPDLKAASGYGTSIIYFPQLQKIHHIGGLMASAAAKEKESLVDVLYEVSHTEDYEVDIYYES